jgi:hypothetical protein
MKSITAHSWQQNCSLLKSIYLCFGIFYYNYTSLESQIWEHLGLSMSVCGREKKSKQSELLDQEKKILCVYSNMLKKNWVGGRDFFSPN